MSSYRKNLFPVPEGFNNILKELSFNVIKDQPEDILQYGMMYFESKLNGNQFIYEGPKRQENYNYIQQLKIYNQLYQSHKKSPEQELLVYSQSLNHNQENSQHFQVNQKQVDLSRKCSNINFTDDFPENIPNIRMIQQQVSKKKYSNQDQDKYEQIIHVDSHKKNNQRNEQDLHQIPAYSAQSLCYNNEQLRSSIIDRDEIQQSNNNLVFGTKAELDLKSQKYQNQNLDNLQEKEEENVKSTIKCQDVSTSKIMPLTNLTSIQNATSINDKYQQNNNNLDIFGNINFSNQQIFANILDEKMFFQSLEDDFKQIDIAEADVQNNQIQVAFNSNMQESALTIVSNYNVAEQIKDQILNYMIKPEENKQIQYGLAHQQIGNQVFSNSDLMQISMVESVGMGIYQKGYLYINIMSARYLPLCTNVTCEVYLEGLPKQKIITQTVYNNNEPDWYYLRKKLILLVPKNIQKIKEFNEKPIFLIANIYEIQIINHKQERIDLCTFKIPLQSIFQMEGQWSINNYFNCDQDFLQAKLYIQVKFSFIQMKNSSLLQNPVSESAEEGNINPGSLKNIGGSLNKGIMASVDLNREDNNHAKIISKLILSLSNQLFRIQGTLRITVVKARQLKYQIDNSMEIQSPYVEYSLSYDKDNQVILHDTNPNMANEPIWFHTQNHQIDTELSHKPVLSLKLFDIKDNDESNKIYLGETNLDLCITIDQPGKWLINNYYDLHYHSNTDQIIGQIYLQTKFIPGGLEELNPEQFGPLIFLD